MALCPACQKEFSVPAGKAIPYRCSHCQVHVLDHYSDLEWVGGGAMGDVYRATDSKMGNRTVAIKIPLTAINSDQAKKRFEREILASARLEHPNVVRAYHRGEECGRPFLVMEFVSGRLLSDVVKNDKPMAPDRVARIILGVAKGLAHGERQGVINRDVKPENIFLSADDQTPKILDYGLALITDLDEQVTRYGSLMGTASYVAPEQARDPHSVSVAADIYSLGCTAYFCLAGRSPFQGKTLDEKLQMHQESPRPSIREVRPDACERFDRLIQEMMAPDHRERPTPKQTIAWLESILGGSEEHLASTDGLELIDACCPACRSSYHLSADSIGKRMQCSSQGCRKTFTIKPQADTDETIPAESIANAIDAACGPPAGDDAAGELDVFEAEAVDDEPEVFKAVAVEAEPPFEPETYEAEAVGPDEYDEPEVFEAAAVDPDDDEPEVFEAVAVEPEEAAAPDNADVATGTSQIVDGSPTEETVAADAFATDADADIGRARAVQAYPDPSDEDPELVSATASDSESDIPTLPLDAMVAGPSSARAETSAARAAGGETSRKKAKQKEKTRRQRRARNIRRVVGVFLLLLCIGSVFLIRQIPEDITTNPDLRWQELMDEYDAGQWAHFREGLNGFEEDFPEDERLGRIPFFRDLANACENTNSLTGNPERALELIQKIFTDHRDNPAYSEYSIDIYQSLVRITETLLEKAAAASDLDKLALARQAFELLGTVGQSRTEEYVAETIAGLTSRIAQTEHAVILALDRQNALDLIASAQSADPTVDIDDIYAQVEQLFTKHAALSSDRELLAALEKAHKAEHGRVRFYHAKADSTSVLPAVDQNDRRQQGRTLVVAWGGDDRAEPSTDPDRIVLALARGILYAFDRENGRLCWARRLGIDSFRLPTRLAPTDISDSLLIAVNSETNRLLALKTATGDVAWRYGVDQNIVAPLTVATRSKTDPNAPDTLCGLLPTQSGEIHVIELVLGKPLGRFDVGYPMTLGGWHDKETQRVFFAADSKRIFAINLAAVEEPEPAEEAEELEPSDGTGESSPAEAQSPPETPENVDRSKFAACTSILFTNHASGALRSEPMVVGQYLIVLEASELEHTKLKAFEVSSSGFRDPNAAPLKELSLSGWAWFSPHSTPDRITLVTDQGDLGLFGLNLDNRQEAIYPIVEPTPGEAVMKVPNQDSFRTMAVHAEEHLLWIVADARLQKFSVDILRQEIKPLWSGPGAGTPVEGIPVHKAQVDRDRGMFYLTTMSSSGDTYWFTAINAETGQVQWQRRLGVGILGDPFIWDGRVVAIDRTGQTMSILPGGQFVPSDLPRKKQLPDDRLNLPPQGADLSKMIRLGEPPGPINLVVPMDDNKKLAMLTLSDRRARENRWTVIDLNGRLHGRPCISDGAIVAACYDGQLHRIPREPNEVEFTWARSKPPGSNTADGYSMGPKSILLVDDDHRRLRRLTRKRTAGGVVQWQVDGREFFLPNPMVGRPLLHDGGLFVFDSSGTLFTLDPADPHNVLDTRSTKLQVTAGPFLRNGRLLVVVENRRLACLTTAPRDDQKQPLWVTEPFLGSIRGIPSIIGDTLLVADSSSYVKGISITDGSVVATVDVGVQAGVSAAPVPYGTERMLVPLDDGTLLVLPLPKEEPEEESP